MNGVQRAKLLAWIQKPETTEGEKLIFENEVMWGVWFDVNGEDVNPPGALFADEGEAHGFALLHEGKYGEWHIGPVFLPAIQARNNPYDDDAPGSRAHAHLAGPELLGVLKEIVEALRKEAPGTPLNNHRFDALGARARAVIAKAEGASK